MSGPGARRRRAKRIDEPSMSDKTLVLNLDDLISFAFGPTETNVVNFNMLETVLNIFARQMRLLEQEVEIKYDDVQEELNKIKANRYGKIAYHGEGDSSDEEYDEDMSEDETYGATGKRKRRGKSGKGTTDDLDEGIIKGKSKHDDTDQASTDDIMIKDKKRKHTRKGEADDEAKSSDDSVEGGIGKKAKKGKRGVDNATSLDDLLEGKKKSSKYVGTDDDSSKTSGVKKTGSKMGLTVSEIIRKGGKGPQDTILVVEKGPTTRDSHARVGGIDVVTRGQFERLKVNVEKLMEVTEPMATPSMPDENLKMDIAKGTATLPVAMEAMQVNARLKEAEGALTVMATLLTQLAAAGAFPPEMSDLIAEMQQEQLELLGLSTPGMETEMTETLGTTSPFSSKSVAKGPTLETVHATVASVKSKTLKPSTSTATKEPTALVTHFELSEAIDLMKQDLTQNTEALVQKSTKSAERTKILAKRIEERLDVALNVDKRIDVLQSLTADYAEQLRGFDSGFNIQFQSFNEQMAGMQHELKSGLADLESTSKAESLGMIELKNGHNIMDGILRETAEGQVALVNTQREIVGKLQSQLGWVEKLRDEKADRDEVDDGLRDKADDTRLGMLIHEEFFKKTWQDLSQRLQLCYEKFSKQDNVWVRVLEDIQEIANKKADNIQYCELREYAVDQLNDISEKLYDLEIMLGEPKAAILTRQLSYHDTSMPPAMTKLYDGASGKPPPLKDRTLHEQPVKEQPCETIATENLSERKHACNRWVGGSHTLVNEYTTNERAPALEIQQVPTKHYLGYGLDRRLYNMEAELQPCVECNQLPKEELPSRRNSIEVGGGDQGTLVKDRGIK